MYTNRLCGRTVFSQGQTLRNRKENSKSIAKVVETCARDIFGWPALPLETHGSHVISVVRKIIMFIIISNGHLGSNHLDNFKIKHILFEVLCQGGVEEK